MIAILRLSLTCTLSVSSIKKKPIRKEPVILIRKVGNGNLSKTLAAGEMFIK